MKKENGGIIAAILGGCVFAVILVLVFLLGIPHRSAGSATAPETVQESAMKPAPAAGKATPIAEEAARMAEEAASAADKAVPAVEPAEKQDAEPLPPGETPEPAADEPEILYEQIAPAFPLSGSDSSRDKGCIGDDGLVY